MIATPQEKLGSFYLGVEYDNKKDALSDGIIDYDARDLTTHAVCVGMTGSGKTGLCVGLLEEAAIDKVPAIIIDPKGDMTNLMLQFENLEAEDFKKWINPDDAARKGMSVGDYAIATANKWKNGLKEWGQGPERIKMLKNAVDYTIYTPGSNAGIPINIMGSFAAPNVDFDAEAEMLRERIQGTVAALLGMIGSKEDPVRSREGILLSNLFEHYWRQGMDLDLASLIKGIQSPPMKQLGVFDVDTFFPQKERFDLAMDFNSLVASPQFQYWLQGEPLDIDKIYFTEDGKPRHSIFYIAHLSDSERMFFVTLLLNSLITWMRRQSGTSSLRSLLYFDEIFGYFPPTAQPPSKKPLMTLLKQARAFGVGTVLVTQNPVDIDYKGLSNAGTWFIGKLQTERDKMRVLDGLQGAIAEAGGSSSLDFSDIISGLKSRVFLMHNVHDSEPVIFHTRWAMSYLTGPLTRPQIKGLMESKKAAPKAALATSASSIHSSNASTIQNSNPTEPMVGVPPSIDPGVDQRFFAVWKSSSEAQSELGINDNLSIVYQPSIVSIGKVRFYDAKRSVDKIKDLSLLSGTPDDFGRVEWADSQYIQDWERSLIKEPDYPQGVSVKFGEIPETMNSPKEISSIEKEFSNWIYESQRCCINEHSVLKITQEPNESVQAFHMRVNLAAKELRDEEIDSLQEKYEKKLDRIEEKIRKEEQDLYEAEAEVKDRKRSEMIGIAETIFSVFVKKRSRSLSGATSKSRMRRRASMKLQESQEDLEELNEDYKELQKELDEKIEEITDKWESIATDFGTAEVSPRRSDVKVDGVFLAWNPFWQAPNGQRVSARKQ